MTAPAEIKRIVCLANSFKPGGRCVAGKEILAGQFDGWVRPVSEVGGASENAIQYADGTSPCLLDVIDIPVRNALPTNHQRENWLLDPTRRWEFVRQVNPGILKPLKDRPAQLWVNSYSSYTGLNNRVPEFLTSDLRDSLRLIWTDNLKLFVSVSFGEKRIVQGCFRYQGVDYSLRVTDPTVTEQYWEKSIGEYAIGGRYLTVSLGGPYEGYCYKLIAAIIDPRQGAAP